MKGIISIRNPDYYMTDHMQVCELPGKDLIGRKVVVVLNYETVQVLY